MNILSGRAVCKKACVQNPIPVPTMPIVLSFLTIWGRHPSGFCLLRLHPGVQTRELHLRRWRAATTLNPNQQRLRAHSSDVPRLQEPSVVTPSAHLQADHTRIPSASF